MTMQFVFMAGGLAEDVCMTAETSSEVKFACIAAPTFAPGTTHHWHVTLGTLP